MDRGDFRVEIVNDDTGRPVASATYWGLTAADALERAEQYRERITRVRGIAAPLTARVMRLPDERTLPISLGRF